MSYSSKVFAKAEETLNARRGKAEQEQRVRHDEVLLRLPELMKIEREMASAGLAVVKAVGMGEDAQKYIEELASKNLTAQKKRDNLLKSAGYPEDYLKIRYVCEKCGDTGYINGIGCDCLKTLLRSIAFSELCGTLPINRSGFDNFKLGYYSKTPDTKTGISPFKKMSEIYEFCKNYADDFDCDSPSLMMYGETGLGKTHLSLAIASVAVNKGFGVIYSSAQNLLNKIEKEHFGKQQSDEDTTEAVLGCDLLILDDLGAEFSTQFTVSVIYNIINTRLQKELPTIISTNLSMEELESRYSRRIASRIIGDYITVAFFGSDIRQIKGKG